MPAGGAAPGARGEGEGLLAELPEARAGQEAAAHSRGGAHSRRASPTYVPNGVPNGGRRTEVPTSTKSTMSSTSTTTGSAARGTRSSLPPQRTCTCIAPRQAAAARRLWLRGAIRANSWWVKGSGLNWRGARASSPMLGGQVGIWGSSRGPRGPRSPNWRRTTKRFSRSSAKVQPSFRPRRALGFGRVPPAGAGMSTGRPSDPSVAGALREAGGGLFGVVGARAGAADSDAGAEAGANGAGG